MQLEDIQRFDPDAQLRPGERTEVLSLGFCDYATEALLTCAETEQELDICHENPFVAVVITRPEQAPETPGRISYVLSEDPAYLFWRLHNHLATETDFYGAHAPTRIDPDARVDPQAWIAPEGVTIEAGVVVEPFAVIHAGVHLEAGAIVRSGASVGSDCPQMRKFGSERLRLAHRGGVHVSSGAEIGCNAVVCASIFNAPTYIGCDAYIDHRVSVGHQVVVGDGAIVLTGSVLFGTSEIEEEAYIGPGALIGNFVSVGRQARVSPGAFVTRDVAPETQVTGYFAVEHREFLEMFRRQRGGSR